MSVRVRVRVRVRVPKSDVSSVDVESYTILAVVQVAAYTLTPSRSYLSLGHNQPKPNPSQ